MMERGGELKIFALSLLEDLCEEALGFGFLADDDLHSAHDVVDHGLLDKKSLLVFRREGVKKGDMSPML